MDCAGTPQSLRHLRKGGTTEHLAPDFVREVTRKQERRGSAWLVAANDWLLGAGHDSPPRDVSAAKVPVLANVSRIRFAHRLQRARNLRTFFWENGATARQTTGFAERLGDGSHLHFDRIDDAPGRLGTPRRLLPYARASFRTLAGSSGRFGALDASTQAAIETFLANGAHGDGRRKYGSELLFERFSSTAPRASGKQKRAEDDP